VTAKPAVLRQSAERDIEAAIAWYLSEGGEKPALGFIRSLEQSLGHITRHPASGQLRYAHELNLPGLRCWPFKRYPYLVFYREEDRHIDIWRVLHAERDIPAWLRGA
jgi:toxin ParE1/3/4